VASTDQAEHFDDITLGRDVRGVVVIVRMFEGAWRAAASLDVISGA